MPRKPVEGPRVVDVTYRRAAHGDPIPDTAARASARAGAELGRLGLDVRRVVEGDIPKITKDWLRSYRDAPAMAGIGNDIYYANEHALIEELWLDGVWLVATTPTFSDFIAGWLVGEGSNRGPIVHYVYTRHHFDDPDAPDGKVPARGRGIAAALVATFLDGQEPGPGGRVWYTHRTRISDLCLSGRHAPAAGTPGWEYNPFLAWRRMDRRAQTPVGGR